MVRAEPTNNPIAGITNRSTTFTLLQELNLICVQSTKVETFRIAK